MMIGNNSCGTHGLLRRQDVRQRREPPGRAGGWRRARSGRLYARGRAGGHGRGRPALRPAGGLTGLQARYGALVAERFPDIPARVSGFNLDELAPGRGHVARALVGTESTCAFTTEATLHLVTSPPRRCLVAIGYHGHIHRRRGRPGAPRLSLAGAGGLRPDPRRPDGGPRPQSQWRRPAPRRERVVVGGAGRGQHGRGELQSVRSHRRPAPWCELEAGRRRRGAEAVMGGTRVGPGRYGHPHRRAP